MLSELVTKETKSVMKRALLRFSKNNGISAKDNQLLICGGEEGLPSYRYMRNYKPENTLTFNEILGVKFDFKQREFLTAPFLQKAITRLAEEKEVDVNEMSSIIITKDSEADKVYMLAYHNDEFFKQVSFNWLFDNPEEILGNLM